MMENCDARNAAYRHLQRFFILFMGTGNSGPGFAGGDNRQAKASTDLGIQGHAGQLVGGRERQREKNA
jgi:hypothetical protein